VEARNAADSLAYAAEKTLRDNAEKIDEAMKERVEAAVAEVREALPGDDAERIVEGTEKLSAAMQEIGQAIYGQADGNGAGEPGVSDVEQGSTPEGEGEEAGTVEGEFREV
jgi:molecular chaperone DnaK